MKYIKLYENYTEYSIFDIISMDGNKVSEWLFDLYEQTDRLDIEFLREVLNISQININAVNDEGKTLLMIATYNGDVDAVRLLLQHPDIDVNVKSKVYEESALLTSIKRSEFQIFNLLMQHPKINVNIGNRKGWTPLHFVAFNQNPFEIEILLDHPNIDKTIVDDTGLTAWDVANKENKIDYPELNPNI